MITGTKLEEDVELLDGASAEFDHGNGSVLEILTPVFFGSALTNFGVETFPYSISLDMTTSPLPRNSDQ